MMSIRIADKYAHLKAFIESIPERMEHEGETIHNGRNLIKVMQTPDGLSVNVKRYHAPHFLNAIIYSTSLRTPKGQRAYEYPSILLSKGVETPEAVAYIENRVMGILKESYFISLQCPYPNRFYEVIKMKEEECLPLAEAFARFTAHMHEEQLLHRDYSPGNILWQKDDKGEYHFSVVDINRMYFGEVTMKAGCANFARLWGSKKFFKRIAEVYAKERGMNYEDCLSNIMEQRKLFWTKYSKRHNISFKLDL